MSAIKRIALICLIAYSHVMAAGIDCSQVRTIPENLRCSDEALKTLNDGCNAEELSCAAAAVAFVKNEATTSTRRLDTIVRAYEKVLSKSERSTLKTEQATWVKTDLSQCHLGNGELERWSCIGWNMDKRSLEVDRRLSNRLKGKKLWPVSFPITLTKSRLGVSSSLPTYYSTNVDEFQLSQNSDGSFAFSFVFLGGNGHICSGGGNARREGNLFVRVPERTIEGISARTEIEDGPEAELLNRQCKVEIKLFPNHIELEGNRECHEFFSCGARASPDGTFFRDSQARPPN